MVTLDAMNAHGPETTILSLLPLLFFPILTHGQDGALDPTFGDAGVAIHGFGLSTDIGRAIVQQPDGRILVAGNTFVNGNSEFALMRLMPDGSLDLSLDTVGYTSNTLSASGDAAFAMALQPDGRIILAGQSDNGTNGMLGMMRYDANGIPDATFGNEGIVTDDFGGQQVEIHAIALQPDGKVLLAGNIYDGTGRMLVARYTEDGVPDPSFNGTGMTTVTFGEYSVAYAMALGSDGMIHLAGYTESGGNSDLALARLGPLGALDVSFGTGGKVITHLGYSWERLRAMTIDADGAILVTGSVGSGFDFPTFDMVVARYASNGTLDASFDQDGSKVIDHAGEEDGGAGVVLQSDGKILVCGGATIAGQEHFALVRMDGTGALDGNFGADGVVLTEMGSEGGAATAMTMQSDGKILLAGYHSDFTGTDNAVARYLGGTPQSMHQDLLFGSLFLYPNPAREMLYLQIPENGDGVLLQVWDEQGRICRTEQVSRSGTMDMNIADLAPGRYEIRCIGKSAVRAGSFIKLP